MGPVGQPGHVHCQKLYGEMLNKGNLKSAMQNR